MCRANALIHTTTEKTSRKAACQVTAETYNFFSDKPSHPDTRGGKQKNTVQQTSTIHHHVYTAGYEKKNGTSFYI